MATTNGCLSNYAEQKALDHIARNTSWALPTGYLALWTASPTDAGSGGAEVETPGSNGYARVAVGTGGSSLFSAASSRSITNASDISWGAATGAWSEANYWALFDASTGGNLIAYGQTDAGTVSAGGSYVISAGALTITFTAASAWTNAVLNALLDHAVGRTEYTSPTTWVALYNGDPLGAGAESHVAGTNGYARQDLDAVMAAASGGTISNGTAITFGPATGSAWGESSYYAILNASTSGTVLGGGALDTTYTVLDGQYAEWAIGAFILTLN